VRARKWLSERGLSAVPCPTDGLRLSLGRRAATTPTPPAARRSLSRIGLLARRRSGQLTLTCERSRRGLPWRGAPCPVRPQHLTDGSCLPLGLRSSERCSGYRAVVCTRRDCTRSRGGRL